MKNVSASLAEINASIFFYRKLFLGYHFFTIVKVAPGFSIIAI